ncbi:MAG: peptidoglycan DD-metalloendopeptidase family protein [Gammaproteobacteria bacterium]|nr:peptidoglycan DD-metalloendopeptidase family protein [Gammaproteobacteria bacterium]
MPKTILLNCCLIMYCLCLLAACTSSVKAPVDSRSKTPDSETRPGYSKSIAQPNQVNKGEYHIVEKGDTLYSIAWRYGLDYKNVAVWNDIIGNYVIYPGQFIRLKPDRKKARPLQAGPLETRQQSKKTPESAITQKKNTVVRAKSQPKQTKSGLTKNIAWRWPTKGKLVKLNTPTSKKGIDIAGKLGQKVKAAADGDVVYSGSGLLGYGKLIIIKHSDTYLSAYAHNEKVYAKEGDKVKVGQAIATMGAGNKGRPLLHFEIRKDGTPVNPLTHLPKSS